MRITDTSDLWWKTAVVYCVDVEKFMDWNDDGVGDFEGLAHRLDHLAELGVTCLWLMPFQPSPGRDDGYDVADYFGVDERLGTLGDFVEFMRTAKDRGMRVIVDLVVNHTSDQHPWFKKSRASLDNPYRDFYVWRKTKPATEPEPVFPGEEDSVWELDEKTGEYYLHSFYRFQPDLNITNPRVQDEIAKVMGFWLELGVSGFRVDAVPFLLDPTGVEGGEEALPDPLGYLRSLRAFLTRRSGEAMLLGEANLPHDQQVDFFGGGDGDGLTMQFDFVVMQNLWLSLARGDAGAVAEALRARPQIAVEAQWANFLRNHDELTLDKLTEAEKEEVFAAFAPEEEQRIYDRGIVRRLPPMFAGDPRRIQMAYSLMFSLPGTPVLFYGEEIGMGEDAGIHDRTAVRSPMQWTAERNGGFSQARPSRLTADVVTGGFGPEHVNASEQRSDPDSLYSFIRRLAERYRASAEIGWGELEVLEHDQPAVLAHTVANGHGRMLAVHNLSPEGTTVELTLSVAEEDDRLLDLLVDGSVVPVGKGGTVTIALEGYGHRWLRLIGPTDKRLR